MDVEQVTNWPFDEIEHSYDAKDTMLYALGLGFGSDPLDKDELGYVYEDGLIACPSMAVVLAYPGFWLKDPQTGVNWKKLLHGEQWLEIFQPLPAQGCVVATPKVDFISDKGADKGAVIYWSREIFDQASGSKLARVAGSTFCRGDGGFGGDNLPGPTPAPIPKRAPDSTCTLTTLPQQALIYRLSGDYNPLHADPDVAGAAGFRQPILHGLATYGMAARAVLKTFCAHDASRLRVLDVRFSSPVYPGEAIRFEFWNEGDDIFFQARIAERDAVVLNNGRARITP